MALRFGCLWKNREKGIHFVLRQSISCRIVPAHDVFELELSFAKRREESEVVENWV